MWPRLPPPVVLVGVLATGCGGNDGPAPALERVPVRSAVAGEPGHDAGEPDRAARASVPAARVEPPVPEAAAAEPKAERLSLTFVGDIIFGRYRDGAFEPIVAEPSFDPFAEIRPALASDVVVGNLETPVVEALPERSPIDTPYRFGGSRRMVRDWLGDFTVLSLANNHFFDLGEEGQRSSPRILAEEGIAPVGAARTGEPLHRVETHAARGWRIGFLAVTTLLNVPDPPGGPEVPHVELDALADTLLPLVERARADHDLVIVVVHWGDEYFAAPSHGQREAAHRLIDGGVDMVIGHHPHVLQAIERRGAGLIAYSLGNFMFEHTTAVPRLMGVLRTVWQRAPEKAAPARARLVDAVFHPAINERTPHPHPAPATGRPAAQVRARVAGLSRRQGSRWTPVAGTQDLRLAGLGEGPGPRPPGSRRRAYRARSTLTR